MKRSLAPFTATVPFVGGGDLVAGESFPAVAGTIAARGVGSKGVTLDAATRTGVPAGLRERG
jgi:hypothetical protein